MAGRVIGTIVLIATLAAIYLAPQGLLTKPTLAEQRAGPFRFVELDSGLTAKQARARLPELAAGERASAGLPAVINRSLLDEGAPVRIGRVYPARGAAPGSADPADATGVRWSESRYLVAEFPYRGSFSPAFGAWRVYRGLPDELARRGCDPGPVLEIYDAEAETIRYLVSLDGEASRTH